ncbi:MAG: hypothetical protein ABI863_05180, partial [Ginsengibacter sp.]
FFVGFLTSAFAQQDRHRQYGNQTSDNRWQSPNHSRDNNYAHSKTYNDHNGYNKNDQWDKRNNENDYGYNKDRDYTDRKDVRRDQYSSPECVPQKRIEDVSYRTRPRVLLIKILFNIGGIFQ